MDRKKHERTDNKHKNKAEYKTRTVSLAMTAGNVESDPRVCPEVWLTMAGITINR